MPAVKKEIDLEIKSNIEKLLSQTKNLDTAMNNLTNKLNKQLVEEEKLHTRSLKIVQQELATIEKQLAVKKKEADLEKQINAIKSKYAEKVNEINFRGELGKNLLGSIRDLNLGEFIKSSFESGIDQVVNKKVAKINVKANLDLEEIENKKNEKIKEIIAKTKSDIENANKETSEAIEKIKTSANNEIKSKTEKAEKRIQGATDRINTYKEQLSHLDESNPEDRKEINRLNRNIRNNEKIINDTKSGLKVDVTKIKTKRNEDISKTTKSGAEKIENIQAEGAAAQEGANTAAAAESAEATGAAEASGAAAGIYGMIAKVVLDAIVGVAKKIAQGVNNMFKETLGISMSIKDNFSSILKEVGNILSMTDGMATYATGSSLITNAAAREQQLKYGLSDAQNYALSQTMSMMGMKSDDDLMYMNQEQINLFRSFMNKYDSWYNEMQSSGLLKNVQEFQLDFAMFKQELAMEFMQWFSKNKESLMKAIKTIAKVIMKLAELVLRIVEFFTGDAADIIGIESLGESSMSSAMSDYTTYNSNNNGKNINVNVKQENNATGVLSNQEALQTFFGEQMTKLSQELATEMT